MDRWQHYREYLRLLARLPVRLDASGVEPLKPLASQCADTFGRVGVASLRRAQATPDLAVEEVMDRWPR